MNSNHAAKHTVTDMRRAQRGRRSTQIVGIDRSAPFKPVDFLGKCWGIDEEDERALALSEVDLAAVRLESVLKIGETSIKGEARLERLKQASVIRLDAMVFHALWENQRLIPKQWKTAAASIVFDGTVLYHLQTNRYVLCLYSRGGRWHWNYCWLGDSYSRHDASAVLALT